jgi:hypothetical protein
MQALTGHAAMVGSPACVGDRKRLSGSQGGWWRAHQDLNLGPHPHQFRPS